MSGPPAETDAEESRAISVELNPDEALVLSVFLHRFSQTDRLTIEHPGEAQVLWNLCCLMEREATGWSDDFASDLQAARQRLAGGVV